MKLEDNPYRSPQPNLSEIAAYRTGYEKGVLVTNIKYWGLQITIWIPTVVHLYSLLSTYSIHK